MILVTGGSGFIGANLVRRLASRGLAVAVSERMGHDQRWKNLRGVPLGDYVAAEETLSWVEQHRPQTVIHLGACSDTTETDVDFLLANNFQLSKDLFLHCTRYETPFIYASSAAVYGDGSLGYSDDPQFTPQLSPLNPYGYSKLLFDQWVLQQDKFPPHWVGFRFFNVFGPLEDHKENMRSIFAKALEEIHATGELRLFESDHPDFADGEQMRDFVGVDDVCSCLMEALENPGSRASGVYNLGTGKARSFLDVAKAVFKGLDRPLQIRWIPMPENLQGQYQYFTQAELKRFREAGYCHEFATLEASIEAALKPRS